MNAQTAITLVCLFFLFLGAHIMRTQKLKIKELEEEIKSMVRKDELEKIKQKAIDHSRSVLKGKITEHMIPFFPEFEYNAGDARFLGSPIDFIIFDGMSDGDIKQIVIADVKTGNSRLNKNQRMIRDAIKDCNVKFEVIKKVDDNLNGKAI